MDQAVYTISEYCAAEKVSRSRVYAEWARGEGVDRFHRGTKILITHEARVRYREKLEREATAEALAKARAVVASSDVQAGVAA
jgi:hypothetical protein